MTRRSFLDIALEIRTWCYKPVLEGITVARLTDRDVWNETTKWQSRDRVIHQFKLKFYGTEEDEWGHKKETTFALLKVSRQVRQDVLHLMSCIPLQLDLSDAALAKSAIRAMKFDYASSVENLVISDEMIHLCRDLPGMMPRLHHVNINSASDQISDLFYHHRWSRAANIDRISKEVVERAEELFTYLRDEIEGAGFGNATVTLVQNFKVDNDGMADKCVARAIDTAEAFGDIVLDFVKERKY